VTRASGTDSRKRGGKEKTRGRESAGVGNIKERGGGGSRPFHQKPGKNHRPEKKWGRKSKIGHAKGKGTGRIRHRKSSKKKKKQQKGKGEKNRMWVTGPTGPDVGKNRSLSHLTLEKNSNGKEGAGAR